MSCAQTLAYECRMSANNMTSTLKIPTNRLTWCTLIYMDVAAEWALYHDTRLQNAIKVFCHRDLEYILKTTAKLCLFLKSIIEYWSCTVLAHKITKSKKEVKYILFYWDKILSLGTKISKEWDTTSSHFSIPHAKQLAWKLKNSANYLDILVCLIKKNGVWKVPGILSLLGCQSKSHCYT